MELGKTHGHIVLNADYRALAIKALRDQGRHGVADPLERIGDKKIGDREIDLFAGRVIVDSLEGFAAEHGRADAQEVADSLRDAMDLAD